jgi:hypothetical protein
LSTDGVEDGQRLTGREGPGASASRGGIDSPWMAQGAGLGDVQHERQALRRCEVQAFSGAQQDRMTDCQAVRRCSSTVWLLAAGHGGIVRVACARGEGQSGQSGQARRPGERDGSCCCQDAASEQVRPSRDRRREGCREGGLAGQAGSRTCAAGRVAGSEQAEQAGGCETRG